MRITVVIKTIFRFAAMAAIAAVIALAGCAKTDEREILDRSGRKVTIRHPINRIVSSAPSNTEIITDLGMAHKIVAMDRHSANVWAPDGYPEIPKGIPLLDFFYPDAEVIVNLEPDIIIASGHNATGTGEDPFRLLRDTGIPVVYITMSDSIEGIYDDIAFIADLLEVQERGEEVIKNMKAQVAEITAKAALITDKRTVYFEVSAAPEMITFGKDSFFDSMISAVGAVNIFANDSWIVSPGAESIIDRNPDVILTNVDYIDDPVGEIKSRPGFNHVNAVINNRVYYIDNDSSVRPSTRIVQALRQIAHAVYPEIYD